MRVEINPASFDVELGAIEGWAEVRDKNPFDCYITLHGLKVLGVKFQKVGETVGCQQKNVSRCYWTWYATNRTHG